MSGKFSANRVMKMSGLLSGCLLFCMSFTDFGNVFVFSVCVSMLLRRFLMLYYKKVFVRIREDHIR